MTAKPDRELVRLVADDLRHLLSGLAADLSDDRLRRDSAVLRRLLVEENLRRAWQHAGFGHEPMILAGSMARVLGSIRREKVYMASVGEGTFGSITLYGMLVVKDQTESDLAQMNDKTRNSPVPTRLSNFVADPSMVLYGEEISRRTVIKYVANKLGGVHYDTTREPRSTRPKDVRAARHLAYLDTIHSGEWVKRTGMAGAALELAGGKDGVYFHLLTFAHPIPFGSDPREYSVEHVYPKSGPNEEWSEQFQSWGLGRAEIREMNHLKHFLGNLAVLTNDANKRLKTSSFEKKRRALARDDSKTTIPSLAVNEKVVEASKWTPKEIRERGKVLAGACLSRWPESPLSQR